MIINIKKDTSKVIFDESYVLDFRMRQHRLNTVLYEISNDGGLNKLHEIIDNKDIDKINRAKNLCEQSRF